MNPTVSAAIDTERAYQKIKWPDHSHTVGEYLLIMQKCLDDAKRGWVCARGDVNALHEIRQVVTVGIAAMEEHGAYDRVPSSKESCNYSEPARRGPNLQVRH